jgi:hypothetical protein
VSNGGNGKSELDSKRIGAGKGTVGAQMVE